MSNETISQFIERNLYELSEEYEIPANIIPQIAHLIEIYPNPEVQGTKTALKESLAKIIKDQRQQGALQ